jgi:hypothetical protein
MPDTASKVTEQEHPIIFNEWSIRRILTGAKTQTRRVVKNVRRDNTVKLDENTVRHVTDHLEACPFGQPGDELWVREAFRFPKSHDTLSPSEYVSKSGYERGIPGRVRYEADGTRAYEVAGLDVAPSLEWGRKRPSIHMPRELCRLRLRVEDVRVERVQEITHEGALSEGIEMVDGPGDVDKAYGRHTEGYTESARFAFRNLWNEIHGDGAWERNDWVWVVSFEIIKE